MKKCILLAVCVFVALSCLFAETGGSYFEKLGNSILRARTTGGFVEYQFFPDGKLIAYDYLRDGTDSGPDVEGEIFVPKFAIESLRWEIKNNVIYIFRGNRRSKSDIRVDEEYVYFNELAWERSDRLEFFDEISKFMGKNIIIEEMK